LPARGFFRYDFQLAGVDEFLQVDRQGHQALIFGKPADVFQMPDNIGLFAIRQIMIEHFMHIFERVIQFRAKIARLRPADAQVQRHREQEEDIDNWGGPREEVIVGTGDELAHLVDEQAHPNAGKQGAEIERPAIGKQERQQAGNEQ